MARTKKSDRKNEKDQNLSENVEELGATAAEAGEQVQEVAGNLTEKVREQANQQLSSQKDQVIDTMETVSLLLHQAGEHAHQQEKEMLATYVDKAAAQVGRWTDSLREQDVTQLAKSATDFARREPMLFVGGALTTGFLGARFLRSSAQNQSEETSGEQGSSWDASGAGSLPDLPAGSSGTDLPAYDIDQASMASTMGDLGTASDLPPEATGLLEDHEATVLDMEVDVSQDSVDPDAPASIDIDDDNPGSLA